MLATLRPAAAHSPHGLRAPFLTLVVMLLVAMSLSAGAGLIGISHLDRALLEIAEIDAQRLVIITHIRRLFRSEIVVNHDLERTAETQLREPLLAHRDRLRQERLLLLERLKMLGVMQETQALSALERDHQAMVRWGHAGAQNWEGAVSVILQATQGRLARAAATAKDQSRAAKTQVLAVSGVAAALALLLGAIVLQRFRLASQALSESEAQFRTVVQSAPSLLTILSPETKLTYLPPRGPGFLGKTLAQMTEDPFSWVDGRDRQALEVQVAEALSGNLQGSPTRLRAIRNDGSEWYASTSATPLHDAYQQVTGVILQILDISEQCRAEQVQAELEEQLRRAQKMESVGRLAGGIAHDFNNLLTAIKGYASLAEQAPNSPEMPEYIGAIASAADRAAGLTRQLLTFSRKHVISPVPTDLGVLVRRLEKLLVPVIGEDVRLEIKTEARLGLCLVDVNQVEQVVMNLAINARHAMPNGGSLLIETKNVQLDADYAAHNPEVPPGPYVLLAVSDTGAGMSLEVQKRAFEPFFTTKPVGQGTGLGLAVVYGTVQQHGGTIELDSEPGGGTRFRIYWPRLEADEPADARPSAEQRRPRGRESILLVEDDFLVRTFAAKTLTQQGYRVLVAETATGALSLMENATEPPGLLLVDVILPDRNGAELAKDLLRRFPKLPVLFASGYSDQLIAERGYLPPGVDYLPKPYDAATLAQRVREAIDRAR